MFIRYTNEHGDESRVITQGEAHSMQIALRYIVAAHPGEPLLVIRGRDLLLVPMGLAYEKAARVVVGAGQMDERVLTGIRQDMQRFATWQGANGRHLKYADRPAPRASAVTALGDAYSETVRRATETP